MKMKTKILGLVLLITGLISLSSIAAAHAPEYHITDNLCTEENLDYWLEDSGPCDPENPPNISEGITHEQYPHGLCYPSFNNYLDSVDWYRCPPYDTDEKSEKNLYSSECWGMDPFGSNNPPLFNDESNFFQAAKFYDGELEIPWSRFSDNITVDIGDKLQFYVYMHNNGDPCFNDNVDIPTGKFYSSWNTTSFNTRANVLPAFSDNNGTKELTINGTQNFISAIWSANAVNAFGVKGGSINDNVVINTVDNKEVVLELIPDSGEYIDMIDMAGYEWYAWLHDISINPLLTSSGISVSTLEDTIGNLKGVIGDFYACEPYIAMLGFRVEVKEPPQDNVCKELIVTASGTVIENTPSLMFEPNVDFTVSLPSEAKIKWTTSSGAGSFYQQNASGVFTKINETTITLGPTERIFYQRSNLNPAQITATVVDENGTPYPTEEVNDCAYSYSVPPYENICDSVTAEEFNENDFLTTPEGEKAYHLEVTDVTYIPGPNPNLNYIWISTDPNASFYLKGPNNSLQLLPNINSQFSMPDSVVSSSATIPDVYYKGESNVNVRIAEEISPGKFNYPDQCQYSYTINLEVVCKELKVDHPETIYEDHYAKLTAQAYDTNEVPYDAMITYSVDDTHGYFVFAEPEIGLEATPGTYNIENLTIQFFPLSGEDLSIGLSPQNTIDFSFAISNGQFFQASDYKVQTEKELLNLVPEYLENATFNIPLNGVAGIDGLNAQENLINQYELDNNYFFNEEPYIDVLFPKTVTVAPGTPVFLVAQKAGTQVVHVTTQGTDVEDCTRHFDILEWVEPPVCEELKVNTHQQILDQHVSSFTAAAENDQDGTFNGQITYTVEEGYGTFYTTKPAGYDDNPLPIGQEFNPGAVGSEPEDGWCHEGDTSGKIDLGNIFVEPEEQEKQQVDEQVQEYFRGDVVGSYSNGTVSRVGSGITQAIVTGTSKSDLLNTVRKKVNEGFVEDATSTNPTIKIIPDTGDPAPEESKSNYILAPSTVLEYEGAARTYVVPNDSRYKVTPQFNPNTYENARQPVPAAEAEALQENLNLLNSVVHAASPILNPANVKVNSGSILNQNSKVNSLYGIMDQSLLNLKEEVYMGTTLNNLLAGGSNSITVDPGTTVYFVADQPGEAVITISTDCDEDDICVRTYDIEPVCATLQLDSDPAAPLTVGEDAALTIAEALDTAGNPLPETSLTHLYTDTGGYFNTPPTGMEICGPDTNCLFEELGDFPVNFLDSQNDGTINIALHPNDPMYSAACTDTLPVGTPTVCDMIEVNHLGSTLTDPLEQGTLYLLDATATYTPPQTDTTVTYESDKGVFILLPQGQAEAIYTTLKGELENQEITSTNYDTIPIPPLSFSTTAEIPDGDKVLFLTFDDSFGDDALTVTATGRSEADCQKVFRIDADEIPCQEITVTTNPSPYTPQLETMICIDGEYGDFNGTFDFSTTGEGFFHKLGEETSPQTSFTIEEVEACVFYSGGGDQDTITITSVGDLNSADCNFVLTPGTQDITCIDLNITEPGNDWDRDDLTDENNEGGDDDQIFEIAVETSPNGNENELKYRWTFTGPADEFAKGETTDLTSTSTPLVNTLLDIIINNNDVEVTIEALNPNNNDSIFTDAEGNQICIDSVELEGDEEDPDIEKLVYYVKKDRWEDDTINIGSREDSDDYRYITYLAIFDPGTAETAEVWESETDDGRIEPKENTDGYFEFTGMAIAVEDRNGQKYVIFENGFDPDHYDDDDIGPDQYTDFQNSNEDLDFYEDRYWCDSTDADFEPNRVCINHDFNDITDDFRDGEKVEFQNLTNAETIFIIYQYDNETAIDDDYCKDMIEDFGICGEEFVNKINFEAEMPDGNTEDGDDTAEVIVICPFILTREGGDVFFHSAIETGIDVSACYETEGGEGFVVTPEPENPEEITSTGAGDDDLEIIAPTHDVCKLSNNEDVDNPSEYRNVLENFSSSVCEVRAEVAADWKEKNINQAIEANIERIARFGVQPGGNLSNLSSESFTNGVYVTDSASTINGLVIDGTAPAARTYVVKGADLTINQNITYDDQTGVDPTNPSTIPSVAFIVIDGNIEIAPGVTQLDGVYMAVSLSGGDKGKVKSLGDATSEELLMINGNLIGDVFNLFSNRKAIGDLQGDFGSITIRYDQRILLNTPPGLNELIDVGQLRTAY